MVFESLLGIDIEGCAVLSGESFHPQSLTVEMPIHVPEIMHDPHLCQTRGLLSRLEHHKALPLTAPRVGSDPWIHTISRCAAPRSMTCRR